jgi:uncharacterized protein with PIN domain
MRYTIKRVYAIFNDKGEVVITAETKALAEGIKLELQRNERIAEHEAEDKLCPDGSGRVAPIGKHWVRSVMSGEQVLEHSGTSWTCSVASETYWSS